MREHRAVAGRVGANVLLGVIAGAALGHPYVASNVRTRASTVQSDDIAEMVARVQGLSDRAASGDSALRAVLDELIVARERLILAGGNDSRMPTWLLDQAETKMVRASLDGAEASVLVGVPTHGQAERVHAAAEAAIDLVRRADTLIDRAVSEMEERVFGARGSGDAAVRSAARAGEETIARLIDVDRGVRVPLLAGRAGVLASLSAARQAENAARVDWPRLDEALSMLRMLRVVGNPGKPDEVNRVERSRAILLAAGLAAKGDEESRREAQQALRAWVERDSIDAERAAQADRAAVGAGFDHEAWQRILVACCAALSAADPARAEAQLLRTIEHLLSGDIESTAAGALLCGESVARLRRWSSGVESTSAAERAAVINKACAGLVQVFGAKPGDGWRGLVYEKIGRVTDLGIAAEDLTPVVAMAAALRVARDAEAAGVSEIAAALRRGEAEKRLRGVADRHDADGAVQAEALWEGAAVLTRSAAARGENQAARADRVQAIELLYRLVDNHASFRDSREVIEAGAALCLVTSYASPENIEDGTRLPHSGVMAEDEMCIRILTKALELRPRLESDGACSFELAGRLWERTRAAQSNNASGLGETMTVESRVNDVVRVLELLLRNGGSNDGADRVEGNPANDADALARRALSDVLNAKTLRAIAPESKRRLGAAAEAWAHARDPGWLAVCRLPGAEAQVESDPAAAIQTLNDLNRLVRGGAAELSAVAATMLRQNHARIRLALGQAQRRSGDMTGAFRTLVGLTDDLDREPGKVEAGPGGVMPKRSAEFWCAWAELIEVLESDPPGADRSATLRLRINQLELIDPEFGGGACGKRLRVEQEKLAR